MLLMNWPFVNSQHGINTLERPALWYSQDRGIIKPFCWRLIVMNNQQSFTLTISGVSIELHNPWPILMPKQINGNIDRSAKSKRTFWSVTEQNEDGISNACGCYIFAIRAGRGITPYYIGLAEPSHSRVSASVLIKWIFITTSLHPEMQVRPFWFCLQNELARDDSASQV